MQENETVLRIAQFLYSRKAQDIVALNVAHLTVLCDHMIIASGRTAARSGSIRLSGNRQCTKPPTLSTGS